MSFNDWLYIRLRSFQKLFVVVYGYSYEWRGRDLVHEPCPSLLIHDDLKKPRSVTMPGYASLSTTRKPLPAFIMSFAAFVTETWPSMVGNPFTHVVLHEVRHRNRP
ncbi:MAG: hypothetical protein QW057_07380 [Candidatus Bathyarchaeia archaeon]